MSKTVPRATPRGALPLPVILLAEDDELLRESLRELLELEGYQVHAAASGEEALQKARLHDPALVLCDVVMPGMDGYQVLEELRRCAPPSPPRFVFLSARIGSDDRERARRAGVSSYLCKPAAKHLVLDTIRQELRQEGEESPRHSLR